MKILFKKNNNISNGEDAQRNGIKSKEKTKIL